MTPLETLIAADMARPLPDLVRDAAAGLAGREREAAAVLFYGSCLRDGAPGILDFYVLTERPRGLADRLLPPTVSFAETAGLRAKVGVMPLGTFARVMHPWTLAPHLWARFCQPTALAWVRDTRAEARVRAALVDALRTAAWWAERLGPRHGSAEEVWTALFRATYAAELRTEAPDRPRRLIEAAPTRWAAAAALAFTDPGEDERRAARRSWTWRRRLAKGLGVLRLMKAALTVSDGADYIVWKIERHSGRRLVLTDWQRRHPVLAAVPILLRLRRDGVIR